MKKYPRGIYYSLIRSIDKVTVWAIGLAAVWAGCDKDIFGPIKAEYGCPHADFHIKGQILTSHAQIPVENLELIAFKNDTIPLDTSYSDIHGNYHLEINESSIADEHEYLVSVNDIDGVENKEILSKSKKIVISGSDLQDGDGKWYLGKKEVELNLEVDEK